MSYAGFWKRAMATIIDGVILYIVSIIVFAIVATVAESYMLIKPQKGLSHKLITKIYYM